MKILRVPIKYQILDELKLSIPDELTRTDEIIYILNKIGKYKKLKVPPEISDPITVDTNLDVSTFISLREKGIDEYNGETIPNISINFIKLKDIITLAGIKRNFIILTRYSNMIIHVQMAFENKIIYSIDFKTQPMITRTDFMNKFKDTQFLIVEWKG